MGLYDTFYDTVSCPYRNHKVELDFQTKAFSDRGLRNVKIGDSVEGWQRDRQEAWDTLSSPSIHRSGIVILDGLTFCDTCRKMNVQMKLQKPGRGLYFTVMCDIVIYDNEFIGVAHVRGDDRRVIDDLKKVISLPEKPKTNMFENQKDWNTFETKVRNIERKYKLRPGILWRGMFF